MLFKKKYENAEKTVTDLINHLNIPVTAKTIIYEVSLHPNYPTLLAISDTLSRYGIANYAYENVTVAQLREATFPLIAHTKNRGDEFILLKGLNGDNLETNKGFISINDFAKTFNGVAMLIDVLEGAGDKEYTKTKNIQLLDSLRNPVVTLGILFVLGSLLLFHTRFFQNLTWQIVALGLFKLVGLVTSVLLLIQSIDANNSLIQKLCQSDTNKNCNAILSSKSAKVFEGLTWSEVGFFYFSGTFLSLLFTSNSVSALQILAVLNILCLPYTFYSIYYQAKIARQWCIFCCTVQVLLWLEFIPLVTFLHTPFHTADAASISSILISFTLPFILWIWAKPFLLDAFKVLPLTKQVNKFKYNVDLFNNLLTNQAKYNTPNALWSIVLGNLENPDKIITIVSNPYCGPCTAAHRTLEELLAYKPNFQVRYVFVFNHMNDTDIRMVVARQLLALYVDGDKNTLINAMHDWYEERQKNFADWAKKYPAVITENITLMTEKHLEWCRIAEITATPTILVDGYKLPYPYQLSDLKYF